MTACLVAVTLCCKLVAGKPQIGYVFIGPGSRIVPSVQEPHRKDVRAEIYSSTGTTLSRDAPEDVATAPCVMRKPSRPPD